MEEYILLERNIILSGVEIGEVKVKVKNSICYMKDKDEG